MKEELIYSLISKVRFPNDRKGILACKDTIIDLIYCDFNPAGIVQTGKALKITFDPFSLFIEDWMAFWRWNHNAVGDPVLSLSLERLKSLEQLERSRSHSKELKELRAGTYPVISTLS